MGRCPGVDMCFVWVGVITLTYTITHVKSEVAELCSDETFESPCGNNSHILLHSALYGRMALGRCVTTDYGDVGCSTDVLSRLQQVCYQTPSCSIHVNKLKKHQHDCPVNLSGYLLVNYTCGPVFACIYHPPEATVDLGDITNSTETCWGDQYCFADWITPKDSREPEQLRRGCGSGPVGCFPTTGNRTRCRSSCRTDLCNLNLPEGVSSARALHTDRLMFIAALVLYGANVACWWR